MENLSLQRKYYLLPRDNTVEDVSVWNNQLWLNDYGARIKAFPKNKAFNRKATDGTPGPTKSEFSMKEGGRREPHLFFPSSVVLLSWFRDCFCVRMWHGAQIDLWRFPAADISNRSSAPWLSWVNILASGEAQRGWCQLKSLVAIT